MVGYQPVQHEACKGTGKDYKAENGKLVVRECPGCFGTGWLLVEKKDHERTHDAVPERARS